MPEPERIGRNVRVHTPDGEVTFASREYECLELVVRHLDEPHSVIGAMMNISENSVNNYLRAIYQKIGVPGNKDPKGYAIRWYNEHVLDQQTSEITLEQRLAEYQALLKRIAERLPISFMQCTLLGIYGSLVAVCVIGPLYVFQEERNYLVSLYNIITLAGGAFILIRTTSTGYRISQRTSAGPINISMGMLLWSLGGLSFQDHTNTFSPIFTWLDGFHVIGLLCLVLGVYWYFQIKYLISKHTKSISGILITFACIFGAILYTLQRWSLGINFDGIKLFFDVLYPTSILSMIIMTTVYLTSSDSPFLNSSEQRALQVFMRGCILFFVAAVTHSITTNIPIQNVWWFHRGNLIDLLFVSGLFLMTVSLLTLPLRIFVQVRYGNSLFPSRDLQDSHDRSSQPPDSNEERG